MSKSFKTYFFPRLLVPSKIYVNNFTATFILPLLYYDGTAANTSISKVELLLRLQLWPILGNNIPFDHLPMTIIHDIKIFNNIYAPAHYMENVS